MALFSRQVAVNVEDVEKFKESVKEFSANGQSVASELQNALEEMVAIASQKTQELEEIASSYEELYASIKRLSSDIEHSIAALKTQLTQTPKELEEKHIDKDGKETVKKKPNPEYKALEAQFQKESSRLSSVKELSWKVYNEVSHSRRVAGEVSSATNEIKNIIPEVQSHSREMLTKSTNAEYSLERTIRTIKNYINFNFRTNI